MFRYQPKTCRKAHASDWRWRSSGESDCFLLAPRTGLHKTMRPTAWARRRQHVSRATPWRSRDPPSRRRGSLRAATTKAAAARIGYSESTLEKLRHTGDGPPFLRLGGPRNVVDLDAWARSRRFGTTSEYETILRHVNGDGGIGLASAGLKSSGASRKRWRGPIGT